VHRDPSGRPDGFVVYEPEEKWDGMRPNSTLKIEDMIWVDGVAERELWRYLLDVDLVARVTGAGAPSSVLRSVLKDGRAAKVAGRWDHIWARILDVPACFGARSYVGSGRVTIEVLDPFLGRGGTFVLDASADGASCLPADAAASADVTVPISALGAAWFGGTDVRSLAAAGGIDEHTVGGLERLATLLSWPVPPWAATDF
jgi:predicted acetyltransferase